MHIIGLGAGGKDARPEAQLPCFRERESVACHDHLNTVLAREACAGQGCPSGILADEQVQLPQTFKGLGSHTCTQSLGLQQGAQARGLKPSCPAFEKGRVWLAMKFSTLCWRGKPVPGGTAPAAF